MKAGTFLELRRAQRLSTKEILSEGRTPLKVLETAENAQDFADKMVSDVHAASPMDRPVCREGCSWCCHVWVIVSAAEVLLLADTLRKDLSAEALDETRRRLKELDGVAKGMSYRERCRARLPCALLVDGRCSAYGARPMACRGWNSLDALKCEQSYRQGFHKSCLVTNNWVQRDVCATISAGHREGLAESGLRGDMLELTAALHVALEDDRAAERWLAGERIFEVARVRAERWARERDREQGNQH
jgi:hypothetical protein